MLPALRCVIPRWQPLLQDPPAKAAGFGGGEFELRGVRILGVAGNTPKPVRGEESWMLRLVVLAGARWDRASVSLPAPLPPTHPRDPPGWDGRCQPTANNVRDVPWGSSPPIGTPVATGSGKPVPEHLCPCCHHCPRQAGREPGCAPSPSPLPSVGLSTVLGRPPRASPREPP